MTDEPAQRGDEDRSVGERLRAALVLVEPPPADLGGVVARARRRRASRLAATLAVAAVVLAAGVALPLTVLAPGGHERLPAKPAPAPVAGARPATLPAPPPGWVWHRDAADRVAFQTPATWHVSADTGVNVVPKALFMAGTGPLPAGGECAPTRAIKALPRDGALFFVIEYKASQDINPYMSPPRPDRLSLGPLLGPFECIGERTHLLLFRDANRFFQIHVLFGRDAPSSLRVAVLASLESFRPEPATVSLAERCRRQWVFCPEAAWAFRVTDRAGLFHWGNTGKAVQVGPWDPQDPSRRLEVWTTRGGPLPPPGFDRVALVDGITVYGDGRRLLWRVQGLNVWVQAQRPSALPQGAVLAKLVRASLAIPVGS
jgi:hypothetical protein